MRSYRPFRNTLKMKGEVMQMAFVIKSDRKESENKTIRFPVPLIERIEEAIRQKDVTFSGFVIQACEYALENMESDPASTDSDTAKR